MTVIIGSIVPEVAHHFENCLFGVRFDRKDQVGKVDKDILFLYRCVPFHIYFGFIGCHRIFVSGGIGYYEMHNGIDTVTFSYLFGLRR